MHVLAVEILFIVISHQIIFFFQLSTGLPKYYAWLQTAVARGLGFPASRLAGRHTDAAPKHSVCYIIQFPSRWSCASMYICIVVTLAFTNCDYC